MPCIHDSAFAFRYGYRLFRFSNYITFSWKRCDHDFLLASDISTAVSSRALCRLLNKAVTKEPLSNIKAFAVFTVGMNFNHTELWNSS